MAETQETLVWSLGGKIPWRREWQPTPVFLPGKAYEQRSLSGYSPRGHRESDTTEHTHTPPPSSWPKSYGLAEILLFKDPEERKQPWTLADGNPILHPTIKIGGPVCSDKITAFDGLYIPQLGNWWDFYIGKRVCYRQWMLNLFLYHALYFSSLLQMCLPGRHQIFLRQNQTRRK